jgi:O-antigen/teichoic acid export membrane protein
MQLFSIPLYVNASYLLLGFGTSSLFGFAFWIIAARFYSPEDVGLASALIAAIGLVTSFSNLGLGMGLIRFLSHSGKNANSMINTVLTIGTLASIAATVIFVAGIRLWSPALLFMRDNYAYLTAFVIFSIVAPLVGLIGQAFIAARRAGFNLAQGLINNLLEVLLVILMAGFFHSFGLFGSQGISLCVALLFSIFLFLPRVQPGYHIFLTINKEVLNNILRFSFANYINALFWGAPALILPLMIVNRLGAESNAYFSIAWAVASVPTSISGAISSSLFAEASYDTERLGLNIQRTMKMVFLILIPLVILILIIGDKFLLLFAGEYSTKASTLLRILTISTIPLAINTVCFNIKRVENKLRLIIGLSIFMAVATLGLSYLFLPWMGINGVGIAWLATQTIIALIIGPISLKKR